MNRIYIALVGFLLSSGLALAQTVQPPTNISQAIDTAEQQGNGRAIKAEFESKVGGTGRYEVKVLTQDGKIVKLKIDAKSGQVVETENERFESFFARLKPTDLQNAKTTLKQAIAIAEQRISGGRAVEAEVEQEGASVLYEVKVENGDRREEIKIDANGQITKD